MNILKDAYTVFIAIILIVAVFILNIYAILTSDWILLTIGLLMTPLAIVVSYSITMYIIFKEEL